MIDFNVNAFIFDEAVGHGSDGLFFGMLLVRGVQGDASDRSSMDLICVHRVVRTTGICNVGVFVRYLVWTAMDQSVDHLIPKFGSGFDCSEFH